MEERENWDFESTHPQGGGGLFQEQKSANESANLLTPPTHNNRNSQGAGGGNSLILEEKYFDEASLSGIFEPPTPQGHDSTSADNDEDAHDEDDYSAFKTPMPFTATNSRPQYKTPFSEESSPSVRTAAAANHPEKEIENLPKKSVRFNHLIEPEIQKEKLHHSPSITTISSDLLLLEARKECSQLRALNERLAKSLEQAQKFSEDMRLEKESQYAELLREQESAIARLEAREKSRYESMESMYKAQLAQLLLDLKNAQKGHEQFQKLKCALEEEKEIEILTLKRELLQEKEKQLQELSDQFAQEQRERQEQFAIEKEKAIVAALSSKKIDRKDFSCQVTQQEDEEKSREMEENLSNLRDRFENLALEKNERISQLELELKEAHSKIFSMQKENKRLNTMEMERDNLKAQIEKLSTQSFDQLIFNEDRIKQLEEEIRGGKEALNTQKDEFEEELRLKLELERERAHRDFERKQQELQSEFDLKLESLTSKWKEEREAIISDHKVEIEKLQKRNPEAVREEIRAELALQHEQNLKEQFNRLRLQHDMALSEQLNLHQTEQKRIMNQVKEQCTQFYESLVTRLRQESTAEQSKLQARIKQLEGTVRALQEQQTTSPKAQNVLSSQQFYEEQMVALRSRLEAMQRSWSDDKVNFQNLLQETRKSLEDEKRSALVKMKSQYLETLKSIREEIRISKQKNSQAMELEWSRRKQALINQMQSENDIRLQRMRNRYEQHIQEILELSSKGRNNSTPQVMF